MPLILAYESQKPCRVMETATVTKILFKGIKKIDYLLDGVCIK